MTTSPRLLPVLALAFVAACQLQSADPPATPTLTLTPASVNVNAGGTPVTFTATVQNSSETVTWLYSGPGSITPESGPTTTFTPPESVTGTQSGNLTAALGNTGVSATAPVIIYPAEVTPPTEPPPTEPPPTEPPPTNPPPTNPPPTEPPPTNPPPTAKLEVSIAAAQPVNLGMDGTATVTLNATTKNAPDSKTVYNWTVEETKAMSVTFSSYTSEDTAVTFLAADTYTLRLTATNGAQTATDTVTVTVKPAPQDVTGTWSGSYIASGGMPRPLTLELTQDRDKNVTGTLKADGFSVALTGTFDDPELELSYESDGGSASIKTTVTGEEMSGDLDGYSFSAKRVPIVM